MADTTIKRIVMSFEHPALESFGLQFCEEYLPGADIVVQPLDTFIDQCQHPSLSDRLSVLVLRADEHGHLQAGSPLVEQVMGARRPVMVIRQGAAQEAPVTAFRRVVVPLDGSNVAGQAIPIASRVARANSLPVKFVMVIDPNRVIPPAYAYDPEAWGVIEELRTTAHWALSQAETMMRADSVNASSDLLLGSINASLMASIGSDDLVVMTTHGPGHHLRHRDSVARRVLETTGQPILIMRADPQASFVTEGHRGDTWAESMKKPAARIA